MNLPIFMLIFVYPVVVSFLGVRAAYHVGEFWPVPAVWFVGFLFFPRLVELSTGFSL